ncbi:enoyl-CoA hydratase [Pseudoclavibacter sp. JAI123]|uniref:enoyl-CoA hydratase/isomerase family protein n=1 Tax=Pseudoclavibacter sp. JAI123 TaxID=2723065 RepID=UPI0015CAD7A5|nr:enoyl-CoA hydratase-related protein [Pseudoclavibacter sp. JAI123]NYF11961.1 enoyl-CoA hydratase [Pseudoclavibacter sp. JAI123]
MTMLPTRLDEAFAELDHAEAGAPRVECLELDDVAIVVLRNADRRNALTLNMWVQLSFVFRELRQRSDISVVLVRGEGTTAFAAGADISEFAELRHDVQSASVYNTAISAALDAIAALEVPTIAAIRGFAVGGGCELAHACDLRIAADDAQVGIPIGRLGVILGPTEAKYLVRQIGAAGLKRVLLSARLFDAQESRELRLVDEVLPTAEHWAGVRDLITTITRSRPVTVRSSVLVADAAAGFIPAAAFAERMHDHFASAYGGRGLAEGYRAFLEKRTPDFDTEKGAI